jgi:hypothetical protein
MTESSKSELAHEGGFEEIHRSFIGHELFDRPVNAGSAGLVNPAPTFSRMNFFAPPMAALRININFKSRACQ